MEDAERILLAEKNIPLCPSRSLCSRYTKNVQVYKAEHANCPCALSENIVDWYWWVNERETQPIVLSWELRTECVLEYKQLGQEMENERHAPKKGQRTNGPTDMLAHVHPVPERERREDFQCLMCFFKELHWAAAVALLCSLCCFSLENEKWTPPPKRKKEKKTKLPVRNEITAMLKKRKANHTTHP